MSENIIIKDESNKKYFATVPNILICLGLKANEIAFYVAIKIAAGDHGKCTKSSSNLCKESGISKKLIPKIRDSLCKINPVINKPLLRCEHRISPHGDKDTCEITIVDIWPENGKYFENGGRAKTTPPRAKTTIGRDENDTRVGQKRHQGRAKTTHKQEPLNKNHLIKTTATPTPSKGNAVVAVVSKENIEKNNEIEFEAEKDAARSLKAWMDREALKSRMCKVGGCPREEQFGQDWIIPLDVYEKLIHKNGIAYFKDQIEHMLKKQKIYFSGKSKKEVNNPEAFLRSACKDNYAESENKKKGEK